MSWPYRIAIGVAIAVTVWGASVSEWGDKATAEPCPTASSRLGVCLDPGHGGPGACKLNPPCVNGDGEGTCGDLREGSDTCLTEAWVNHEIVALAESDLELRNFYVKCTRSTITEPMEIQERCDIANNDALVDVFTSVHHEGRDDVYETRTFYHDTGSNPTTRWRYKLAQALAEGIDDWFHYGQQVIPHPYYVLMNTRMPSTLTEASSLGHYEEANLMAYSPEHRYDEACGIRDGLGSYEGITSPKFFNCRKRTPLIGYEFTWGPVEGADGYILYLDENAPELECPPSERSVCFDVQGTTSYVIYYLTSPALAVRAYVEHPLGGRLFVGGFSNCVAWWNHIGCFGTGIDRWISSFAATGGDHQVTLTWHAVSFEDWAGFEIWRSSNGGQAYDDSLGYVDYDPLIEDYTFVDATTGYWMTYYYKILDTEGHDWWGPVSARPSSGVVVPPVPSPAPVFAVDHLGDQHVNLCLEQGSQYADCYILSWQPEGGVWADTVHGGEQCFELGELQNGVVYCFRAQGKNASGTSDTSSMAWATPMVCPTNLQDQADHQCIHLWWDGDPSASGYTVYYSTSQVNPWQSSADVGDTTATTITGLENGTLYYVCVVAYDQFSNQTGPSNSVSARPACWSGVRDHQEVPREFALGRSYPNPFDVSAVIPYQLARPSSQVRLVIYDAVGREVRRLVDDGRGAGLYRAVWDGKDQKGRSVPPGVYFYRIEAGDFAQTNKLLLVR